MSVAGKRPGRLWTWLDERVGLADLEKLAHLEHDLWMEAKLADGFTLGTPTGEHPRRNEYLVPWDQVPGTIKEIDRDLIRGIPKILAKAGYTIVKVSTS